MAQTSEVYTNSTWLDYDLQGIWQRQVTLSDGPSWIEGSPWITAVAAVLIAFASPAAYIIIARFLGWSISCVWNKFFRGRSDGAPLDDDEASARLDVDETTAMNSTPESTSTPFEPYSRVGEIMWSSRTPDDAIWGLAKLVTHFAKTKKGNPTRPAYLWKESILATFLIILTSACLGIFVLFAIGGMVSAGIVSNPVVLSDSSKCGVWVTDEEMEKFVLPKVPDHYYFQELEASDYAKRCFGAPDGTDGCNSFVVPEFQVFPTDHTACPFSADLCLEASSAFTLSTNFVNSKQLGINAPAGFLFNRTTTCVPLKRDGYVAVSEDGTLYEYRYGPNSDFGGLTWTSPVNHTSGFSTYNMHTVSSLRNNWEPIDEFDTLANEEITLLFIQSENVFYTEKRHDPVFPAETPIISPVDGAELYYNSDPRAAVLACVDWKAICHPSGAPCFSDLHNPDPESPYHIERVGYYMLLLALRRSSIGDAVQLRRGSALDASSRLVGNRSSPLPPNEQWKIEAQTAFEASLARIQITLRDLVRGAAAGEVGFVNHIDSGMEDMCNMYKFRAVGWKHASVWGLWLLGLSALVVYVLGIEIDIERDGEERDDHADEVAAVVPPISRGYGGVQPASHQSNTQTQVTRPVKRTRLVAAVIARWLGHFVWIAGKYMREIVIRKLSNDRVPARMTVSGQSNGTASGISGAAGIETRNGSWENNSVH